MLKEAEIGAIIEDDSKRIVGNIEWTVKQDHPTWIGFTVPVESGTGHPLVLNASLNPMAGKFSIALIVRGEARIYGLCLGVGHLDPESRRPLGEKHKHRWTDRDRDRSVYVPEDIDADPSRPHDVWSQFCKEARIDHDGELAPLPPYPTEL